MNTAAKQQFFQIFGTTTLKTIPLNPMTKEGQKGFSLIELMIACFVLGIGVLSVTTMIGTSISNNLSSKNDTVAISLAEQVMEELKAWPFGHAALTPGGSALGSDGKLLFTSAAVNGYSRNISLANSDEAGQTVTYQVRWNIAFADATARMKRITIGARRMPSNLNRQPVQLVFVKAQQ
ncbi:MAG TPA: prepilin-type N-terminal cleavage/methylation domain-containing protein [Terriglobia bacterium]|nr:prepilin-type N-terminal cleavage/methylation domain-containing protein [Terriglobia bacterium]